MFFPKELIQNIFLYDFTFREKYNFVINELKKFGTFVYYDDEIDFYCFRLSSVTKMRTNTQVNFKNLFFYRSEYGYVEAIKATITN